MTHAPPTVAPPPPRLRRERVQHQRLRVRRSPPPACRERRSPETLLRQLVGALESDEDDDAKPELQNLSGEILLSLEVDGERYTVVRSHLHEARERIALSPREMEIVRLVAKGLPNKAIAAVLDISPWTVATHLRRAFSKLGVSSRAEVVARVMQEGYFPVD